LLPKTKERKMNNDDLLKALGKFSPQQIADAIARSKQEETTRKPLLTEQDIIDRAVQSESDSELERQLLPTLSAFDTEDQFTNASFDRQMMRQLLDEIAQDKFYKNIGHGFVLQDDKMKFADLHKWWDGTGYRINNDWLFTDLKEIEIELRNKNQESKFFRLRVSL
jgi:hypothetical protein